MGIPCTLLPKPIERAVSIRCYKTYIVLENMNHVISASRNGGPALPRYYSDLENVYKFQMERLYLESMARLLDVARTADKTRSKKKAKRSAIGKNDS